MIAASQLDMLSVLDVLYPLGARFYTDIVDGHPTVGVWELTEQGRFAVGYSGSAPYTAAATGGSKDAVVVSHTHSSAEHAHTSTQHNHTLNGNNTSSGVLGYLSGGGVGRYSSGSSGGTVRYSFQSADLDGMNYINASDAAAPGPTGSTTPGNTGSTGSSAVNANLPPYKVLYVYKRVG